MHGCANDDEILIKIVFYSKFGTQKKKKRKKKKHYFRQVTNPTYQAILLLTKEQKFNAKIDWCDSSVSQSYPIKWAIC